MQRALELAREPRCPPPNPTVGSVIVATDEAWVKA
jgi:pyrimidine deaminase RibD-like protein